MAAGETLGFDEVEVNPAGELTQEYVLPLTDAAPMDIEEPVHIVAAAATAAAGKELTVTVTEPDLLQMLVAFASVRE